MLDIYFDKVATSRGARIVFWALKVTVMKIMKQVRAFSLKGSKLGKLSRKSGSSDKYSSSVLNAACASDLPDMLRYHLGKLVPPQRQLFHPGKLGNMHLPLGLNIFTFFSFWLFRMVKVGLICGLTESYHNQ